MDAASDVTGACAYKYAGPSELRAAAVGSHTNVQE